MIAYFLLIFNVLIFVLIAMCMYFRFLSAYTYFLISVVLGILDAAYEVMSQFV